jgi:L-rhamnose mutarotase
MIKVQHEHEQEWWDAREALVKKQGARAEGQKKLDEVL